MPQTAVEWLIEKQMDAGIGIPKEWREQAKEKEIEQMGYTKEEFLNAAELGEVSMIDAMHIVSLLDKARSKIGNSDNSQTAVEWFVKTITDKYDKSFMEFYGAEIQQAKEMYNIELGNAFEQGWQDANKVIMKYALNNCIIIKN